MATDLGLAYRPAQSREHAFSTILPVPATHRGTLRPDTDDALTARLMERIGDAAKEYAAKVKDAAAIDIATAELPPVAAMLIHEALKCGRWAEAVHNLRSTSVAGSFRAWTRDVVECLQKGDSKGIRELNAVNRFIEGWATNPDEGVQYKTRQVGIGKLSKYLLLPLNYTVRDPVIHAPGYLVFLNGLFKATVSLASFEKLSTVRMS